MPLLFRAFIAFSSSSSSSSSSSWCDVAIGSNEQKVSNQRKALCTAQSVHACVEKGGTMCGVVTGLLHSAGMKPLLLMLFQLHPFPLSSATMHGKKSVNFARVGGGRIWYTSPSTSLLPFLPSPYHLHPPPNPAPFQVKIGQRKPV